MFGENQFNQAVMAVLKLVGNKHLTIKSKYCQLCLVTLLSREELSLDYGGNGPHPLFKKYIYIYIGINFSNFIYIFPSQQYHFSLKKKKEIIDSFKSNIIATTFSIIFLQIFKRANSYLFVFGSTTYIFFYLPITIHHIINL